jgi:uncharacterized protein YgiM (DUF1202 family)
LILFFQLVIIEITSTHPKEVQPMKIKDKNTVVLIISAALIVLAVIIAVIASVAEKSRIENNNTTEQSTISTTHEATAPIVPDGTQKAPDTTAPSPVADSSNVPGIYTVNTKDDPLGVRTSPKQDAQKVYELPKGSDTEVLATYDKWAYIKKDSINGWVKLDYLTLKEKGETPKHNPGKYTIGTQNDPLGIRTKPEAGSQQNGEVPKGEEVEILTVCGEWGYVEYGEYSGWLSFQYLK